MRLGLVFLSLGGAIIMFVGFATGPALCADATPETNLALLKSIDADLVKSPGNLELQVRHMQALGVARRYQEELNESESLISKFPRLRAAHKGRMFALVGLGNWSEALVSITRVGELCALSASELATRGAILNSLGRYTDALVDLNASIAQDASDPGAFFSRAECFFKLKGPCAEAIKDLESTLKLDSNFPNAEKLLKYMKEKCQTDPAQCEETVKGNLEYQSDLAKIESQLAKTPDNIELQIRHAEVLGSLQRFEDEVAEANALLRKDAKLRDAYLIRAHGESNLRRYGDAVISLDKAFQIGPPTTKLLLAKASFLKSQKKYLEAISLLNQILKDSPSLQEAYLYRAFCNHQLYGPTVSELTDLETLSRLQPSNKKIQVLIAEIRKSIK